MTGARACLEEGFALYQREQHRSHAYPYGGHDPGVCCQLFSGFALWALGYPDQALTRSRAALDLARDLSHPFTIAQALSYGATLHQLRRDALAAREHARDVITLTRDQGFAFFLPYGNVLHGWALAKLGDNVDEGLTELREGLGAVKAIGNRFLLTHWLALLADVSHQAGLTDEGLAAVAEGLQEVRRTGQCFSESELHRLEGELHLLRHERDEAEACLHEAIEVARRQSARSFELRASMSLARLWQSQHRTLEARRLLEDIYGWFTEGMDTTDLIEARALLAALS